MKLEKGTIKNTKEISKWVGNENHTIGIKQRKKDKNNNKVDRDITILFFAKGSYSNYFKGKKLYYKMKTNGKRLDPINDELIRQGKAHVFTQIGKEKTENKFIYHGFRKLLSYDKDEEYFVFDINEEYAKKTDKFNSAIQHKKSIKKYKTSIKGATEIVIDYLTDTILPADVAYEEGHLIHTVIKIRRRNKKIRELAIEKYGLNCEICTLDLKEKYGDDAVAHVHHIKQLSELTKDGDITKTTLDDVIVLCPSCHSVFHKNPKMAKSVSEMRKIVKNYVEKSNLIK